jgi:hypothetical protein
MGDHKKTHCKKGHLLEEGNVVVNSYGGRQYRTCLYERSNRSRRERTAAKAWLRALVSLGERRIKEHESISSSQLPGA